MYKGDGGRKLETQFIRNQDSSPTGKFTDTHFEGSSPTELKTVHRQILFCIYMECQNFHRLLRLYNKRRPNIKLIKLSICYCNMILLDMHTTAYIAIITLSVRKYVLYH